jgi:hypothetical protein
MTEPREPKLMSLPVVPLELFCRDDMTKTPTLEQVSEAAHYSLQVAPLRSQLLRYIRIRASLMPTIEESVDILEDLSQRITDISRELLRLVQFCPHNVVYLEADPVLFNEHRICAGCHKVIDRAFEDTRFCPLKEDARIVDEHHAATIYPGNSKVRQIVVPRRHYLKNKQREYVGGSRNAQLRRLKHRKDIAVARIEARADKAVLEAMNRANGRAAIKREQRRSEQLEKRLEEAEMIAKIRWDRQTSTVLGLLRNLDLEEVEYTELEILIKALTMESARRGKPCAPAPDPEDRALQKAWTAVSKKHWDSGEYIKKLQPEIWKPPGAGKDGTLAQPYTTIRQDFGGAQEGT